MESVTEPVALPTDADVSAKIAAEFQAGAAGNAINPPPYPRAVADPEWLKFQRESEERSAAERAAQTRLHIFAEILRSRDALSAADAAEQTVKVYELLK